MGIRDNIGVTRQQAIKVGAIKGYEVSKFTDSHTFNPDLPQELLTLDIKIGDIHLEGNLRDILYYGRQDLSIQDDREIDVTLDSLTEWRISIGSALSYCKAELERLEHLLYVFELEETGKAHLRIIDNKQAIQGKVTQETLKASKDERMTEMLNNQEARAEWESLHEKIRLIRRDVGILSKVDESLKDRTTLLMGISKRRFTERTNSFLD